MYSDSSESSREIIDNVYQIYKKYQEDDYILTNYFTKKNSYLAKIYKVNRHFKDDDYGEYLHILSGISSILVKIPKISLDVGFYKDIKDEFKNFMKNNCYHREFCLCEKEEGDGKKCKKCNCIIYQCKQKDELKRKNSIKNKFLKPKTLSRPLPISFLDELNIGMSLYVNNYSYIKRMMEEKKFKEINTSRNYFIKLTNEQYRYYIKKYVYLDKFCLFLFSQYQKKGFYLSYGLNRYIFSYL